MCLRAALALVVPFVVFRASAFLPPIDTSGPVEVRIEGVPETAEAREPLRFDVVVKSTAPGAVAGAVVVSLNDDWAVQGDRAVAVDLAGPGERTYSFVARASERVLAAHYPVHAEAALTVAGHGVVTLHPIAVFTTVLPTAADAAVAGWGIPGGTYECIRTPPGITIDGDLDDWPAAVSVACGAEQRSTGSIAAESFDGAFMAAHDGAHLYVAVQAADDDVSCSDAATPDFMNSDYVRLYLSAVDPEERDSAGLTADDAVLAVSVLGAGDAPSVRTVTYGLPARDDLDLSRCRFAARRTAAGYVFEAAIPLAQIGTGLGAGSVLGANVLIGDADSGRRVGEMCLGRLVRDYWLSPASYFRLVMSGASVPTGGAQHAPPLVRLSRGAWPLERIRARRSGLVIKDAQTVFRAGWAGHDERTGAAFRPATRSRGGVELSGFEVHPPWRHGNGGGPVWTQYRLELPAGEPAVLSFRTAIRDHTENEPPSDGVDFRVYVSEEDGPEKELFARFTAAKTWEPATVDLGPYAGRHVSVKLWSGPGPEGNTVCDSGFWGAPTITVGHMPTDAGEGDWEERLDEAGVLAQRALAGEATPGALALVGRNGRFGAGIVPGPNGVVDAAIAFADGERLLRFRGFALEVDEATVGDWRSGVGVEEVHTRTPRGSIRLDHILSHRGRAIPVVAEFRAREGALLLSFSMPGVERDSRGHPRFTRLALGPGEHGVLRAYMGFGNVVERPEAFKVRKGGFSLSTRHVGADYTNGLSLLQATDVYPDQVVCRPEERVFALEAHHDATFTLIPSARGAFAAARHYRDLNGFRPGKGVRGLLGRMCIDQWGGDYADAAEGLEQAARYGLGHSVFVKHVWQRWGYDYRLPEIYPPQGGLESFRALAKVCARNGILFAPHDNYIDFYPDAEGFSYDHIIFNRDGSPQRAWFNKGRKAQSYRWLPHAFMPWLEDNMRLMRNGFRPTSLFIDVFSAIPPIDYYDRDGRFYTSRRTATEWSRAFDVSRRILGRGAPMLSECGHDGLVGSLDGAQADHHSADRWGIRAEASCRTPWHDMASHGSFVLLAGGLGSRYGNKDSAHGYGSDDYLSNTVMGGRNPMCDGPFSRRTVMTYWLLHDVCNALAHASLETHGFADGTVRRQYTTFGDGSEVWCNRGGEEWTVHGVVLPEYGFLARTPAASAAVCRVDGQRVAFARSADTFFADARPRSLPVNRRKVATRVLGGEHLGEGRFRLSVEWRVLEALHEGVVPFVHICHPAAEHAEQIAFQGHCAIPPGALGRPGRFACDLTFESPATSVSGEYTVRYGLYNPKKGGGRIVPLADLDGSRVRGGIARITTADGRVSSGSYVVEDLAVEAEVNVAGTLVDFGPVLTNGAFRLDHAKRGAWRLVPLPGSLPFEARLRLDRLGAREGTKVAAVECIDPFGPEAAPPEVVQRGNELEIRADALSFGYWIRFGR